ncbi:hypothetical protein [Rhizobium phage RHph_X2_28B]|uniref:hypothetical protein n=1 Tax=Rhizobium phage RHph_X2_28B TaxID=2836086 RepID=UPI0023297731|nr:hypothetical protein PP751_gp036 [Rhizobium phage RHph_X2_28B]QWY83488.1 hypothetical protein [Rhizobium phage RHph_X2_28B]QWY83724.1 hypothetical protein [Rhizobium phage RHph_X3_15]
MDNIYVLMTCTWTFDFGPDGHEEKALKVDDEHELHSVYASAEEAQKAAKYWKHQDERSGLISSRYWVTSLPVLTKAPVEDES